MLYISDLIFRMESQLKKAFQHIQNEEIEEGLEIISAHLLMDCIMLMSSITGEKNKYELYSLYYDNFLDFVEKIKDGRFEYVSDSALKSFFKTGCTHKAREQKRLFNKTTDWLSENFFETDEEAFENAYEEKKAAEYERVFEKYGVDLASGEKSEEFPMDVVRAFHTLNEKCKFLVVMKYMLNLSHKDIVDCLCNFYELKNENVSKSELKRCIERLKKNTETRLN